VFEQKKRVRILSSRLPVGDGVLSLVWCQKIGARNRFVGFLLFGCGVVKLRGGRGGGCEKNLWGGPPRRWVSLPGVEQAFPTEPPGEHP